MIVAQPLLSLGAVALGGACGASLRWGLSLWLNPLLTPLALGTLVANLGGGLLMGLALAFFEYTSALSPALRLFITTGLLGSLTTFSTFSAEALQLLQRDQPGWALLHILLHLGGSLLATWFGYRLLAG